LGSPKRARHAGLNNEDMLDVMLSWQPSGLVADD